MEIVSKLNLRGLASSMHFSTHTPHKAQSITTDERRSDQKLFSNKQLEEIAK